MTILAGRSGVLGVLAAASAAVALWGGTPIVTKIAVMEIDPLSVGVLRTLLAAAIAGPLVALWRPRLPRGRDARAALAVSALGGFVIFPLLFSLGMARTSAAHGALVIACAPLFTGLIAAVVERRPPGGRWWLGAAVALAGVVLLVDARFGLAMAGASLAGDLLVLLSCLAAAVGYVAGARAAREVGSWPVTLWGLLAGGAILLPLLPWARPFAALAGAGVAVWAALLYLALLSSILAYAAWYWALAQGSIVRTGAVQFAQPAIGLALAALVLGEALTPPLLLAACVIVGGTALARSGTRERPSRSNSS